MNYKSELKKGYPTIPISLVAKENSKGFVDLDALIDTGATSSYIHESIVEGLSLNPIEGVTRKSHGFGANTDMELPVYDCLISFPDLHADFGSEIELGLGKWPEKAPFRIILGFDILQQFELIYKPARNHFELIWIAKKNINSKS